MQVPAVRPTVNNSSVMFRSLIDGPKDGSLEAVVEKRSSSNMFWNKRSITLINGLLSYYSKVYQPGTDWSTVTPKASVHVLNIVKIAPPEKPKKPNTVQVTFLVRDRIKYKSKQKLNQSQLSNQSMNTSMMTSQQQPVVITSKKEVCVWEFAYNNAEMFKLFVQAVDDIKCPRAPPPKTNDDEELLRSKLEEERKLEQERLMLERQLREKEHRERLKVEAELERQRLEKEREMQERREIEARQAQEKLRLQQELQQQRDLENQRIQREHMEQQKRQALKTKLGCAWNYRFVQAIEKAHMKRTTSEAVEASFIIHASIASMKQHAVRVCKTIIDELVLPVEMKKYRPTQSPMEYFSVENVPEQSLNFGDDIYITDGFFVKLAFTQIRSVPMEDTKQRKMQVYDETMIKSLGNEFRCMSLLADIIEEKLQQDPFYPLRVPLASMVDYKGVRAFALALPPTNNQSQVLGMHRDGTYLANPAVFDLLCGVASELNLKVHKLTHEFTSIEIALTLFAEVHQLAKEEHLELRWIENDTNIPDFAPQHLNLYVLQKCADLMPMYIDPDRPLQVPSYHPNRQFTQRLRPELLQTYHRQLNSDAFLANNKEQSLDDQDVVDAAAYLRKDRVASLVAKLESLDYLPIDSPSLTEAFHRMGVNMRLLGVVCYQSQLPHVKQICCVEMVARVCKKVFRNNLADLLRNLNRELQARLRKETMAYQFIQDGDDVNSKERMLTLVHETINQESGRLCLESGLDFLNLVLGTGRESDIFWKQIITKQAWYDYGFQIDCTQRGIMIPKGLLLTSLLHQCSFNYFYETTVLKDIFAAQIPLRASSTMGFTASCHYYQLNRSKVGQVVNHFQYYKSNNNKEMIIQSVNLALKLIQCQEETQHPRTVHYLTELAECYFNSGDLVLAEQNAQDALRSCLDQHVNSLNPLQILIKVALAQNQQEKAIQLFQSSLALLEQQLGESHPIHCILYCILAYHYMFNRQFEDAYTLYKSGLISAQRVLGQNHPQTAQVCTDLGTLLTKMNQKREAMQLFQQAMNIFQAAEMVTSLPYARNILHLAQLHYTLGSVQDALQPAREGIRIFEMAEFQQINQLLEAYILVVKILGRLQDWEQMLVYCDNIYGVLERHMMVENNTAILEFTITNIFLGILSQMTQMKREWLLEMIQEMNAINQAVDRDVKRRRHCQHQVRAYQDHLHHFIQSIRQSEMGSLVRLQQDVIATIMNNTERMINDSDDQMEEELKISVRLLESITFVIGPLVIQDLVTTPYA